MYFGFIAPKTLIYVGLFVLLISVNSMSISLSFHKVQAYWMNNSNRSRLRRERTLVRYAISNTVLFLGQVHICGEVKAINRIPASHHVAFSLKNHLKSY
jgi:hypothetical protein